MANPRDVAARNMAVMMIGRAVKRHRYDEKAIMQILRFTADKAKAVLHGQLEGYSMDELERIAQALD
jgi:hypothetical protein